jgi:uncharacterized membrane protein YhiD involved in acid resistance
LRIAAKVHRLTTAAIGVVAALGPLWLPAFAAVLTWAILAVAVRFESSHAKTPPAL